MCIIRRANASDAEAIGKLYTELNTLSAPAVLPERVSMIGENNHTYLLVCDDDGHVIATA